MLGRSLILPVGLFSLLLASLWYIRHQNADISAKEAQIELLENSIRTARAAERVAREQLERQRLRAEELEGLLSELEDGDDAPLPDDVRNALRAADDRLR